MTQQSLAVRTRAAAAVALLVGFYALAFAVVAALVTANVWIAGHTGRVSLRLVAVSLLAAVAVLRGVFFVERRSGTNDEGVPLSRDAEPRLWSLIDGVAAEMDTTPPDEVRAVDSVNAYVYESGGLLGLRRGRRHMGIGLGLVQVLTADQLRAVLAHELGHYVGGDTRLGAVNYRAGASIGRTVHHLGARTLLGRVFAAYGALFLRVSLAVRRRQELTADIAAVRVGGREAFVSALREVHAAAPAYEQLLGRYVAPVWASRQRPDDLFAGFRALLAEPRRQHELEALRNDSDAASSNPYDSHPSLGARIVHAETLPDGDRPRDTAPARSLFNDIVALERHVTRVLSERVTGTSIDVGLTWEQAARQAYGPAMLAEVRQLLDAVAAVDGGPRPADLARLCRVLEGPAAQQLAAAVAGDLGAVPQQHRSAVQSALLHARLVTVVACALVEQRAATWRLSWAGPLEVETADGDVLEIDNDVDLDNADVGLLRSLRSSLRAEGIDLSWTAGADRGATRRVAPATPPLPVPAAATAIAAKARRWRPWLVGVAVIPPLLLGIAAVSFVRSNVSAFTQALAPASEEQVCANLGNILAGIDGGNAAQPLPPLEAALLPPSAVAAPEIDAGHLDLRSEARGGTNRATRHKRLLAAGYVDSVLRVWRSAGEDVALSHVTEFATPAATRRYHAWSSRNTCQYAGDVFAVPSVPNAVGFANHYGYKTGVQITFLAGNRRHIVLVMHDEAPADYDAEIALAERAYRRAVKHK